jgi:hypothetical protein
MTGMADKNVSAKNQTQDPYFLLMSRCAFFEVFFASVTGGFFTYVIEYNLEVCKKRNYYRFRVANKCLDLTSIPDP